MAGRTSYSTGDDGGGAVNVAEEWAAEQEAVAVWFDQLAAWVRCGRLVPNSATFSQTAVMVPVPPGMNGYGGVHDIEVRMRVKDPRG
jgi:hypothetical protein